MPTPDDNERKEKGATDDGVAGDGRATDSAPPNPSSLDLKLLEPSSPDLADLVAGTVESWENALVFEDGEWFLHLGPLPRYPLTSYIGAFKVGPDEDWCRDAVARAKEVRCPSAYYMANVLTGFCFAVPCLAWRCEVCQQRKWLAASELFRKGIEAAFARGERVRFVTLTDGGGEMSIEELGAAWDDLSKLLRKGGPAPKRPRKPTDPKKLKAWPKTWARYLKKCRARKSLLHEYAAVVEFGAASHTGRIHLHVLMTGEFIAQRQLSNLAQRSGFGPITHISEVRQGSADQVSDYAAKMASYTAKMSRQVENFHARGAQRVKPVRSSRGWCEGGVREVEYELQMRRRPAKDENLEAARLEVAKLEAAQLDDGQLETARLDLAKLEATKKKSGPWALIERDPDGTARWMRTVGNRDALPQTG